MHNLATTRDVADRLGISVRQVARLAGSGALKPALKLEGVRGAMLFDPAAVEQYAKERTS